MADDAPTSSKTMTMVLGVLLVVVLAELGWGFFRPAESLAPPAQMHHAPKAEAATHAGH